ncbi:glycosyltransferase [Flavobacterium sp. DSR2-3-3]|uniref:glycosyltransferase n=1 Tax=Flavobacterium sp. DSR2-3-3 TaxID=2804632 RepID=UPI003CE70A15
MLAVVIPYYKLTFFESTLISLIGQTDKRFNVYIGDDDSPENPCVLLEKYKSILNFVYQKFEGNLGSTALVKQWERCVGMVADEKWIMILGDDDTIENNCVASFYKHIAEVELKKINVIRYATIVIDQNDAKLTGIHEHPIIEKSSDFLMRKFKGGTRSSLSEYVFRKSILKSVGFKNLPLAWYADLLAVLEVSNFDAIYTINEGVVCFRISGLNITSRNDNLTQKNIASFQFYHYLLKDKKHVLNREQKNMLLKRLEKTFLDNKKNANFWMLFTKLYISNFYFKKYLLFIAKMLKSILKKTIRKH